MMVVFELCLLLLPDVPFLEVTITLSAARGTCSE